MSDANFPDGLFYNKPHENAPDFVRGNLGIQVDKFTRWLQENADHDGRVNIDMKVSKGGKMYLQKNDWKPKSQETIPDAQPEGVGGFNDDIPF